MNYIVCLLMICCAFALFILLVCMVCDENTDCLYCNAIKIEINMHFSLKNSRFSVNKRKRNRDERKNCTKHIMFASIKCPWWKWKCKKWLALSKIVHRKTFLPSQFYRWTSLTVSTLSFSISLFFCLVHSCPLKRTTCSQILKIVPITFAQPFHCNNSFILHTIATFILFVLPIDFNAPPTSSKLYFNQSTHSHIHSVNTIHE